MEEVADQIEDRSVKDRVTGLDRLVADRLDQEALAHSRRPQPEHVAALAEEPAARQVVHLLSRNRRVERPVKVLQRLPLAKLGRLEPSLELAIATHRQFILEDQLQEFFDRFEKPLALLAGVAFAATAAF